MNSELLDRIEEAAITGDVVEALLLCQKLGGDADSAELRDWARHELEGYPQEVNPPEYRRVRGQLFGRGAAPGQRVPAVPIPMDVLSEAERKEFANGVPIWDSISEIAKMSQEERVGWVPSRTASLLRRINASNQVPVEFDEVYFGISGAAFTGVVTAVRSRIVRLVTLVRATLPADKQLDPGAVQAAVSEAFTGSVVNVIGDGNTVTVGDSGDVQISAGSDGRSADKPMSGVWQWVKRVLEAITVFGAAVGFVGGGPFNPF